MPIDYPSGTMYNLEDMNTQAKENAYTNQNLGKYNVGNFTYPDNLGNAPDLQHYVAFYVNVREKSKLKALYDTIPNNEVPINTTTNKINSQDYGKAIGSIAAGKVLLAGGLAAITKFADSPREAGRVIRNFAIGGAAAYGGAEILKRTGILENSFVRLKDVITLHVEDRPTVKYGMNYNEADLGVLSGFLASVGSAQRTIQLQDAIALGAAEALKLPNAIGGATIGQLLGAAAGVKINPFREALFESIDYRTFTFRYRFFPKSLKETNNIKRIIDTFKLHMHPELAASGFFFIYPSEFEIKYFYKDKENLFFNKIGRCALTDMAIEYGGDTFSTFDNGAPTQINVTLTFRELEQLTKQEMVQGY